MDIVRVVFFSTLFPVVFVLTGLCILRYFFGGDC